MKVARSRSRSEGGYVSTTQAARMLDTSVAAVRKLTESGRLESRRTGGGHRRIALASIGQAMPQRPQAPAAPEGTTLKVLVVEDNAVMRRAYDVIFRQWGGLVDASYARDGEQALAALAVSRPDVLILDLRMQPIDGQALLGALRASAELASLPVVVVTGALRENETLEGLDARTVLYAKPVPFARLAGYLDAQIQFRALAPSGQRDIGSTRDSAESAATLRVAVPD